MLHRDILLAAEAAAHKCIFHHNPFLIPTEHNCNFLAAVIHTLIAAVYFHPILIRHADGTLRLQKSMLGKWRCIVFCYGIFRFFKSLFCISPSDMAGLAYIPRGMFMQLRRPFSSSLMYVPYRLQHLIINVYKFFGFRKNIFCLCYYKAYCITYTTCNIAFCNHYIPVLLDMPNFIIWNILGC